MYQVVHIFGEVPERMTQEFTVAIIAPVVCRWHLTWQDARFGRGKCAKQVSASVNSIAHMLGRNAAGIGDIVELSDVF